MVIKTIIKFNKANRSTSILSKDPRDTQSIVYIRSERIVFEMYRQYSQSLMREQFLSFFLFFIAVPSVYNWKCLKTSMQ